jgi:glycosyltransferase involved in cell wall biosynthesis
VIQIAGATDNAEWLVQICRRLRDSGYEATAIIGEPERTLASQLRAANVPFDTMALSFAPQSGRLRLLVYMVRLPLAVLRLAWRFRRRRADIVHTHIFNSIVIGRLAAWIARVPHRVAMVPGPLHLEAPFTRWVDRLTWWMDDRVISGCKWTRDRYRALGMTEPRLACIGYGADAARFDPTRSDAARVRRELGVAAEAPLVGLVAHFYPPRRDWQTPPSMRGRGIKGHEDFIEAARLIHADRPNATFLLVGGGWGPAGERYRSALESRCRAEGLGDAILFTGHRTDIPDVLAALDVAVQCSLTENFGGTIEALLMERPTVATRVGGMPETVRHGRTGLLVPPHDPRALAAAVLDLLDHPIRGRELARAGRQLMLDRHQISETASAISRLYDGLLSAPARVVTPRGERA